MDDEPDDKREKIKNIEKDREPIGECCILHAPTHSKK